jgi:hypothetical protein
MLHSGTRNAVRHKRAARPETRLVLPEISTTIEGGDVLKSLIDTWLVPRLVDQFVEERAFKVGVSSVESLEDVKKRGAA